VELVTGGPFFTFLSKRISQPLGITSAINLADKRIPKVAAGCSGPGNWP